MLLSIVRGAAGDVTGDRATAIAKLEAIADGVQIPTPALVGVVNVNSGGVAEHVCGEVALVCIDNLLDPKSSTEPDEIDELVAHPNNSLGQDVAELVGELREIAQARRVAALQNGEPVRDLTAEQLDAAIQAAGLDPDEVTRLRSHGHQPD